MSSRSRVESLFADQGRYRSRSESASRPPNNSIVCSPRAWRWSSARPPTSTAMAAATPRAFRATSRFSMRPKACGSRRGCSSSHRGSSFAAPSRRVRSRPRKRSRKRARVKLQSLGRPSHTKGFTELPEGLARAHRSELRAARPHRAARSRHDTAARRGGAGARANPVATQMQRLERAFGASAGARYAAS